MHPTEPISIIIADDHDIYRQGFKMINENQKIANIEFVDEACNGVELVEKTKNKKPNIVITDIKMPLMDGLEACRIIRKECPHTKVIALSMYDEPNFIKGMFDAGASGYLTKNSDQQEVLHAIKTVNEGFTYFSKKTIGEIAKVPDGIQYGIQSGVKISNTQFSLQELKVIKLLCKQMSTKEIAHHLQLSARTIEDYRNKIMERIGAKNSVGIALYAFINGIVILGEL